MRPVKDGATSTICDGGYRRNYGVPIHRKRHSLGERKRRVTGCFNECHCMAGRIKRSQGGHYPDFWEVHVSCRDGLMECTGRRYDARAVSLHGLVREDAWVGHGPVDHVAAHAAVTPVHFVCQQHRDTALATAPCPCQPAELSPHPLHSAGAHGMDGRMDGQLGQHQECHLQGQEPRAAARSLGQLPATRALPLQLSSISTAKLEFGLTLPPPKTSDPPKTSIPRAFGAVERVCTL